MEFKIEIENGGVRSVLGFWYDVSEREDNFGYHFPSLPRSQKKVFQA